MSLVWCLYDSLELKDETSSVEVADVNGASVHVQCIPVWRHLVKIDWQKC